MCWCPVWHFWIVLQAFSSVEEIWIIFLSGGAWASNSSEEARSHYGALRLLQRLHPVGLEALVFLFSVFLLFALVWGPFSCQIWNEAKITKCKQKLFPTMDIYSGPGGDPLRGDTEWGSPGVMVIQKQTRLGRFGFSATWASWGEWPTVGGWLWLEEGRKKQKQLEGRLLWRRRVGNLLSWPVSAVEGFFHPGINTSSAVSKQHPQKGWSDTSIYGRLSVYVGASSCCQM